MAIINSFLDQDLYKLTTGQLFFYNFKKSEAIYKFKCRSGQKFSKEQIKKIREEINHLGTLRFTEEELKWLRKTGTMSEMYLDYLKDFRFIPDEEVIVREVDGEFQIVINDDVELLVASMYEIFVLAIVQEVWGEAFDTVIDLDEARRKTQEKAKKIVAPTHPLTTKLYDGLAIQDLYGKTSIVVPYQPGCVSTINVKELDGYKVLDAKRIGHVVMVIGEKKGQYDCITLLLDKTNYTSYICMVEDDVDYRSANFTVKHNGLVVKVEGDNDIKMFVDFKKAQVVPDTPVDIDMKIFGATAIMFINHDEIHIAKSK